MKKYITILLYITLLVVGMGVYGSSSSSTLSSENHTKPKMKTKMKTIPPDFEKIDLNSFEESSCTPQKIWLQDVRGIWIATPIKVIANGDYKLPLCGSWKLSSKFMNNFRNFLLDMTIVIVNSESHQSYSDNFSDKRFDMTYQDSSPAEGSDEELEKTAEGGYFNVDVFSYVPKLPKKPGKYIIYVMLGDKKSNVVNVEVVDK